MKNIGIVIALIGILAFSSSIGICYFTNDKNTRLENEIDLVLNDAENEVINPAKIIDELLDSTDDYWLRVDQTEGFLPMIKEALNIDENDNASVISNKAYNFLVSRNDTENTVCRHISIAYFLLLLEHGVKNCSLNLGLYDRPGVSMFLVTDGYLEPNHMWVSINGNVSDFGQEGEYYSYLSFTAEMTDDGDVYVFRSHLHEENIQPSNFDEENDC